MRRVLPADCLRIIAVCEPLSAMSNEHSGEDTPRPPLCQAEQQIMWLARTSHNFNLPDLYTFIPSHAEGLSHIEATRAKMKDGGLGHRAALKTPTNGAQ
jgi:hypothetical protein